MCYDAFQLNPADDDWDLATRSEVDFAQKDFDLRQSSFSGTGKAEYLWTSTTLLNYSGVPLRQV